MDAVAGQLDSSADAGRIPRTSFQKAGNRRYFLVCGDQAFSIQCQERILRNGGPRCGYEAAHVPESWGGVVPLLPGASATSPRLGARNRKAKASRVPSDAAPSPTHHECFSGNPTCGIIQKSPKRLRRLCCRFTRKHLVSNPSSRKTKCTALDTSVCGCGRGAHWSVTDLASRHGRRQDKKVGPLQESRLVGGERSQRSSTRPYTLRCPTQERRANAEQANRPKQGLIDRCGCRRTAALHRSAVASGGAAAPLSRRRPAAADTTDDAERPTHLARFVLHRL